MKNRRQFIAQLLTTSAGIILPSQLIAQNLPIQVPSVTVDNLASLTRNEELWNRVRASFAISKAKINMNNGGVSPQPTIVLEAEKKYAQIINEMPSYQLWRVFAKNRSILRQSLAHMLGAKDTEIAIMQNTTEAIQTVLQGMTWQAGDEIIVSKQDYSTVKIGWEQLEQRYQVKIVWVDIPSPIENISKIVNLFNEKFSSRTRLVFITHIINWTGQIIPSKAIRRICEHAREKGVFSLVDGAHSFAQLDFEIKDLACDAFATSLHKWLCGPLGMGLLYLKEDRIKDVWSMYPSTRKQVNSIEKFEHKGTYSLAKEEATHTAIDFHNEIGIKLKENRLNYLREYWTRELKKEERIVFYTSHQHKYAGAIALFDIKEANYKKVSSILTDKYKIHHTTSEVSGAQGIRISPNIYTSVSDLDRLVEAITQIIKS